MYEIMCFHSLDFIEEYADDNFNYQADLETAIVHSGFKRLQFPKAQQFVFFLSEYFSSEAGSTWAHILFESGVIFVCFWFNLLWYFICTICTALINHNKKSGIIPICQGRIFISLEKYSEQIPGVSWGSPGRTPAALCLMLQMHHSQKAGFAAEWPHEPTRFAQ